MADDDDQCAGGVAGSRAVAAVLAVGRNGAFGRDGRLPWTMPGDLARFRALTTGTPMIMGRRTFAAIGRALPERESIVVSRDPALGLPPGVHRAATPGAALALARARAVAMAAPRITLIGGAALFAAMEGCVDRLHLTLVELSPDADTFLPPIDPAVWRETGRRVPPRHRGDEAACVFIDYERASASFGQTPPLL